MLVVYNIREPRSDFVCLYCENEKLEFSKRFILEKVSEKMRFVTVFILPGTCGRYAKPEERSLFSSKTGHSTRGPGVLICTGHIHCRYVPPPRVGSLRRFGTKTGI